MCSDSFWLDESELGAVIPQPLTICLCYLLTETRHGPVLSLNCGLRLARCVSFVVVFRTRFLGRAPCDAHTHIT